MNKGVIDLLDCLTLFYQHSTLFSDFGTMIIKINAIVHIVVAILMNEQRYNFCDLDLA